MLPKAGRKKWSSLVFSLDSIANILTRMRIAKWVLNEHEWARTCFWFSCKRSFVGNIPLRCLLRLAGRKECFEQTRCLSSIYPLSYCDRGEGFFFLMAPMKLCALLGNLFVASFITRWVEIWTCSAPLEKERVLGPLHCSEEAEKCSLAARAHSRWILSLK